MAEEKQEEDENPFTKYAGILRSDYGAACDLRALVVNLFNGGPVEMGSVMKRDDKHVDAALEMLLWYSEYGENDPVFMEVARRLA